MTTSPSSPLARTSRRFVLALAAAPLLIGSAFAQAWPSQTIKIVVPFPPGGPTDTATRIVGQKLAERLKQPVVVENKAGASGSIAAQQFLRVEFRGIADPVDFRSQLVDFLLDFRTVAVGIGIIGRLYR